MLELVGIGLVQIAWWEPPHSCGGARLSSRAARVGLILSGFSRGVSESSLPRRLLALPASKINLTNCIPPGAFFRI